MTHPMSGIIGKDFTQGIVKKDGSEYSMRISVIEPKLSDDQKPSADVVRMQMAIRSLKAGTWTLDISKNLLVVCDRCEEIIGVCNEENVKVSRFCDLIAPGHSKKVVETFLLALKTGSPFDVEVPIVVAKHLCLKWLRIAGTVAFNNESLTRKVHGVVEDISDRKNRELLKQDLLAMASHDLRSPLSVIKLYMQLCDRRAGNTGNNYISEILKKAGLQVHKMDRMIQCYLESSAIQEGKISYSPVRFDIKELLREVISDLYLLYPGYIIFLRPGPDIEVYADREKIAQVVQNLLGNAIKYSSCIDVIAVNFKKIENCLQVSVEDRGIGIKAADQEHIFDRFYRVQGENEKAVKGYGIGLYLCKEIIKQHKGDIWLVSEVNNGSKFYFTLPIT